MLTYRLYYIYVLASKLALHLRSIFVIVNVLYDCDSFIIYRY